MPQPARRPCLHVLSCVAMFSLGCARGSDASPQAKEARASHVETGTGDARGSSALAAETRQLLEAANTRQSFAVGWQCIGMKWLPPDAQFSAPGQDTQLSVALRPVDGVVRDIETCPPADIECKTGLTTLVHAKLGTNVGTLDLAFDAQLTREPSGRMSLSHVRTNVTHRALRASLRVANDDRVQEDVLLRLDGTRATARVSYAIERTATAPDERAGVYGLGLCNLDSVPPIVP